MPVSCVTIHSLRIISIDAFLSFLSLGARSSLLRIKRSLSTTERSPSEVGPIVVEVIGWRESKFPPMGKRVTLNPVAPLANFMCYSGSVWYAVDQDDMTEKVRPLNTLFYFVHKKNCSIIMPGDFGRSMFPLMPKDGSSFVFERGTPRTTQNRLLSVLPGSELS